MHLEGNPRFAEKKYCMLRSQQSVTPISWSLLSFEPAAIPLFGLIDFGCLTGRRFSMFITLGFI